MSNETPRPDYKSAYRTIVDEFFPPRLEMRFSGDGRDITLTFEKKTWSIGGEEKGLRYGENPGQQAALYRLTAGTLSLGDVQTLQPGRPLVSDVELLQSGKHPSKINLTDADNALNILRYLMAEPCCVIVKHNNPCGVARGATLAEAYQKAFLADRVAAFGGAIAFNREVDRDTADLVLEQYAEVIVAPEYAPGVLDRFAQKKNLRVLRIRNMARLQEYADAVALDFKSLVDGGLVVQTSFVSRIRTIHDFQPAVATWKGREYRVERAPTERELKDLLFGWLVECGVTSNSVLYVKDGVTVGIGTGEQDRVGVAEIARDKAYRKLADRLAWEQWNTPYHNLTDPGKKEEIDAEVRRRRGGLPGSVMISDAFFPFRDGIEVGLREGVTAVAQPGGSERDFESIEACNEYGAAMVFTGQRCFKH